ncbi:MAG: hypothetical protein H6970_00960 [Gammaproteobacteria bacterium]|nr:hypothetical protein [Gammaproteobacteria bacterium]MCP5423627.1 hypothetical protein [Gammaproteobacteria bacterium]
MMAIEHIETPLTRYAPIDGWGLEAIRRLEDGSIDYGYYLAQGRQEHGRTVFRAAQGLVRPIRWFSSWVARLADRSQGARPALKIVGNARITRVKPA